MKKVISVVLTLLMLFSICSTAVFAIGDIGAETSSIVVHSSRSQVPVVRILGDGEPLYNEKQEKIVHIRSLSFGSKSEEDDEEFRILVIETFGWFNYSYKRCEIINFCEQVWASDAYSDKVRNEALKTVKRLSGI